MPGSDIHWINIIGSSILVSIACIDPGNLQGDIQVAQEMSYKAIWVLLFAHVLLYFFQEMSIDLAAYGEKDLATQIGRRFSKGGKYFIWITSEMSIIAADIQELLGTSIAMKLLFNIDGIPNLVISILIVLGVLYLQQINQSILEYCFFVFVGIMAFCFISNFFASKPDFFEIMNGFIPSIPNTLGFTGVIGSIIMPQNLFMQSSLVMTRNHHKLRPKVLATIIKIETIFIIFISFLINLSLVGVFGNKKFADEKINLENAGIHLKAFLPGWSAIVWSIGLLSSGISSTTTGALTGQYLMDGIVQLRVGRMIRILVTRMMTLIPCIVIITLFDTNRIIGLLNVIQFVQLPFVIIPLVRLVMDKSIMGHQKYNLKGLSAILFFSFALQIINIYSIYGALSDQGNNHYLVFAMIIIMQTGAIYYLIRTPLKEVEEDSMKPQFDADKLEKLAVI